MSKIMRSAKTALLYCGLSKEDYEKISPLIAERDFSFADIISVAMVIFGLIFLISQLLAKATILFPYYFLILSGILLFVLGKTMMNRTVRGKMLYRYLQIIVVFAFATILSAQGDNREQPSVSIIVFLALLPLTINDRPLRMAIVVYGSAFVYLICASHVKAPAAFKADLMNTLTFATLGMAVYLLISNRNIHEIYLRQQQVESDRLREKMRAAEMANAAKSDFLANMSHEIRTPINAVLGMNEMILRESAQARDLPPREREEARGVFADICNYAWNIRSAGNNLLSIINDVLDFSKIEAGRLDIVEADYRLSSVLNDVSNMISFRAREKGLDFRVDVDDSLPDCLHGDEVRVRQIITNLLVNAVKYTNAGSVTLTVRMEDGPPAAPGETVRLRITVEDTGIGIRQEDIGRLFQKFERVDLQKNSTVEGTGLGLAITRSLLDLMGGSIDVESEYGKGSVFTVILPQKAVSPEPVGSFQERFRKNVQEAQIYTESFRAPDAHILAVDDTRMNLTVVSNLLKNTGIEIDTAISGAEAIALCGTVRYDLILMDQRMPEMDGIEAMRRIRAAEDGPNRDTPFICLTADAIIGARERYIQAGFTDYLTKPVDCGALMETLMKYLPPEKVTPVEADAPDGEEGGAADDFAGLREAGVDPAVGLGYCREDASVYRMLLEEYAKGEEEKTRSLRRYYDARDWKNYAVLVHSLKSASRMIGASALSDAAAELEAAADEGREQDIVRGHAPALEAYSATARAIRETLQMPDEPAAPEEDEILEFFPEDG